MNVKPNFITLRRFLDDSDVDYLPVLAEDLHQLRLGDRKRQVAHVNLLVVVDLNTQVIVVREIPRERHPLRHHELHSIIASDRHHVKPSLNVKLLLLWHLHSFLKTKSKILF